MWRCLAILALTVSAEAEPYVAVYLGAAWTAPADVHLQQPGTDLWFRGVHFGGRSFESPVYYGYRAGYFFTRHFGVEAEFIHLKVYADLDRPVNTVGTLAAAPIHTVSPMRTYLQQFEVSHGLNMVFVNAVFRRALIGGPDTAHARLILVARAGLGPTIPRPEVIVFGIPGGSYQAGPVAFQAAAGVEARLWRGLHLITEYKYTFTSTSFDIPNGSADFHVHSNHVIGGFSAHF